MLISPIGRLTQKISDQLKCCTSQAPVSGPTIAATPQTLESQPCTLARSRGE